MLPWAIRDQRVRFLAITAAVLSGGLAIETWLIAHYVAPFTAGFYALLVQCMRHLRTWRPGGQASGRFLVRAIPTCCILLAILRIYAEPLHLYLSPDTFSTRAWFGTKAIGLPRATVLSKLEHYPGKQLAIVRYASDHNEFVDWVYNEPDIDGSKVVWAREMSPADNAELLQYFRTRNVWLVEPDAKPPKVSPYFLPHGRATSTGSILRVSTVSYDEHFARCHYGIER